MLNISFLDLSSYAGLVATVVLTFNFLLGMMVSTAYKKHNYWKLLPERIKQINVYNLHNRTAYVALLLVLLHPILLLFDASTKFKFIDIIFPINAPNQKLFVALGTLSMFAIITVVITTQKVIKREMSFRVWKNIHLISYGTAMLFVVHGIVMDPQLKDRPVDIFDAEKMVSELCLLLLITTTIFRIRYEILSRKNIKRFHLIDVADVVEQTNDSKTFIFEIPDKLKEQFVYLPGQFIILKLLINNKEYKRAYSLSSCPYTSERLQITVKRIQNGIVSNYLNDISKKGDKLLMFPPSGIFFTELENGSNPNYLFFAGGSGITPIYAIIKALLNKNTSSQLKLVYANRNEKAIIFKNELEILQQNHPDKFLITHVLSDASGGRNGMKGRLDKDKMGAFLTQTQNYQLRQTEYYICGPSPFMEMVQNELLNHEIPNEQIHIERFISIDDNEEVLEVGNANSEANNKIKRVYAIIDGIKNTVDCDENQNILDALLKAGIEVPYSCREGVCSSCLAKLISGKVKMKNHSSLTDEVIKVNKILTCQAIPLSNETEIDYDEI